MLTGVIVDQDIDDIVMPSMQVDRCSGKAAAVEFVRVAAGTGCQGCVGANGGSLEQKGHTGLSLGVFFARKVENVGGR